MLELVPEKWLKPLLSLPSCKSQLWFQPLPKCSAAWPPHAQALSTLSLANLEARSGEEGSRQCVLSLRTCNGPVLIILMKHLPLTQESHPSWCCCCLLSRPPKSATHLCLVLPVGLHSYSIWTSPLRSLDKFFIRAPFPLGWGFPHLPWVPIFCELLGGRQKIIALQARSLAQFLSSRKLWEQKLPLLVYPPGRFLEFEQF